MALIGHQRQWENFLATHASGHLGNAYLIVGPEAIGKETFVRSLFAHWVCEQSVGCGSCFSCRQMQADSHPDVHVITGAGQPIKIEPVRYLQQRFSQTSVSKLRLALITDADLLTPPAANALLKLLEEPPQGTSIFLTSSRLTEILPTIRSRCRLITLQDLKPTELAAGLATLGFAPEDIAKLQRELPYLRPGEYIQCLRSQDYLAERQVLDQEARQFLQAGGEAGGVAGVGAGSVSGSWTGIGLAQRLLASDAHADSAVRSRALLATLLRLVHWQLKQARNVRSARGLAKLAANLDKAILDLTKNVNRRLVLENLAIACHSHSTGRGLE